MTDTYDPVGPLASAALSDSESAAGGTGQHPLADLIKALPPADLMQHTEAAVSVTPIEAATSAVPSGFKLTTRGVFAFDRRKEGEEPSAGTLISGPLKITARTRDEHGNSWGQQLEWTDADQRLHVWHMARKLLAGDQLSIRQHLLDGGLYLSAAPRAQRQFAHYLSDAKPKKRLSVVSRTGWHNHAGKAAFVLPNATLVAEGKPDIFLQTENPATNPPIAQSGTLEDWQANIAALAVGNSRLALGLGVAFAAPLMGIVGLEGGGFNLQGASSIGKSSALKVSVSVFYGGRLRDGLGSWRSTDNSLEAVAAAHCDLPLALDEMGEADPFTVGKTAYMLANGRGKGRANQDGSGRRAAEWRLLFLSSGEIGLNEAMQGSKNGTGTVRAGQEVRIVDLPARVGELGLFETCKHFGSSKEFAEHLSTATQQYYGTAGMAWLRYLVAHRDQVAGVTKALIADFVKQEVPEGASGQVARVANRFGLVAAAGEIAAHAGILPWPLGEATRAASACFGAWRANRAAGDGTSEEARSVEAVRKFIAAYGDSRFTPINGSADSTTELPDLKIGSLDGVAQRRPLQRAGYRKRDAEGWLYLIDTSVWKEEVCAGLNATEVARVLADKGHLVRGDGVNLTVSHRVPDVKGKVRFYTVRSSILAE
jgi:putative DNA primase/helicase